LALTGSDEVCHTELDISYQYEVHNNLEVTELDDGFVTLMAFVFRAELVRGFTLPETVYVQR
jgi:hypothetical protein